MKRRTWTIALSLSAALAMPIGIAAQGHEAAHHKPKYHTYKLVDLGTLGGPNSYFATEPIVQAVDDRGTVVGAADTQTPDPNHPGSYIAHAYRWRKGRISDLGTLPGGQSSVAFWVNGRGLIIGDSDNGRIDPVLGIPEARSVIWKHGEVMDLGTLGAGVSSPNAMNRGGQVVGIAQNAIPDKFSFLGVGTETRAYLWEGEEEGIRDLGTLGGPDAWAAFINGREQVVGWSYTDSTPHATTGIPTQHPFLWEDGDMKDLGTLGGTLAVVGSLAGAGGGAINNRGQVVGTSNLRGDQTHHPFLWEWGKLRDLHTLGGKNGEAYWINDSGDVVGRADVAGSSNHHAFLWRDGKMKDLGTAIGWPCSTAVDINARGEIIVDTGICGVGGGPGSLSEDGGRIVNLNNLVLPGSNVTVGDVAFINDRGEIAATGLLPNGDQHSILLIPDGDCDDACESRIAEGQSEGTAAAFAAVHANPANTRGMEAYSADRGSPRDRLQRRFNIAGQHEMPPH
jgi:probable HAF family extracellular repeat protein